MACPILTPLFALALVAAAPAALYARANLAPGRAVRAEGHEDEVHLKSGKVLKGLVVYEDEDVVILRVGSHDKTYPRDEVEGVVSRADALTRILGRLDVTDPGDAGALLAIAEQADEAGLRGEAELVRMQALLAEPDNEQAHLALGHKQNSKGWRFKVGGRWKPFESWPEITGKWKERYEFHTTHFDLESDLPLPQVVRAALDLERVDRALYGLLGDELEMKEIDERLAVQIHAGDASYPEPGDDRLGWFSPGDLILFVLGKKDLQVTLAHQVCHQILYYATRRSRGARGQIPAWIDEGIAQSMEFGVARGRNGMLLELGAPHLDSFRTQATHDDPFSLTRVLTMQTSDFRGGTDTPLKYAEAYTLVHFMLHASEGSYRAAFFVFMRSAWNGQSSMTHFKNVLDAELDMSLDDFEERWQEYVAKTAGAS